jgi:hypothetical protein
VFFIICCHNIFLPLSPTFSSPEMEKRVETL